MERYGVIGVALDWLNSYPINQYDSVKIGDAFFCWAAIPCGVPQGSVFGPLEFSLHNIDLSENRQHIIT